MNTIGLLGGMSWESTAIYYRLINQLTRVHRGRLHSAPLLIWSVDFENIRTLQVAGQWDKSADILAAAARRLERAGARLLLLCTNTMHKVAPEIEAAGMIDQVIFEELCNGIVSDESRRRFLQVIEQLRRRGAEAVIAGCTEIGMLVQQRHLRLPLFDTTRIHAEEAVRWALVNSRSSPRAQPRARAPARSAASRKLAVQRLG